MALFESGGSRPVPPRGSAGAGAATARVLNRFMLVPDRRDERARFANGTSAAVAASLNSLASAPTAAFSSVSNSESLYVEPHSLYRHYFPINLQPDIAFKALVKIGPNGESSLDQSYPLLRFQIHELTSRFDSCAVRFDEVDGKLSVVPQDFICEAKIAVGPMHEHEASWKFGFVTAAAAYHVVGKYARDGATATANVTEAQSRGRAAWELPCALISCSDAAQAPWHIGVEDGSESVTHSRELRGPASAQNVELSLRSGAAFRPPHLDLRLSVSEGTVELFKAEILLKYFTWLVMHNTTTGTYYVVRTFVWTRALDVAVRVAPHSTAAAAAATTTGERARLQDASILRDGASTVESAKCWPLPERTLGAPFAAQELTLRWYPAYNGGKKPCVLSGPDHTFSGFPRMPTS